ncbi:Clostridial hydrophobic W [anaerobic digester metagenome]
MKKSIQKLMVYLLALLMGGLVFSITAMAEVLPSVSYCTHVQNEGWQNYVSNGDMSGTEGKSYRLEGIKIKLDSQGYELGLAYQTHIQNIGWEADTGRGWKTSDSMSGTEGLSYRLEAIQIKLTGTDADQFDLYYQVHAQNIGWMGWAKNGESAGTAGYGYRLEGIRIKIVPKDSAAPGSTANAFVQPSSVEQLLNKMNGDWIYQSSKGKTILRVTKTSPSTGHMGYEQYIGGGGDSMEFDFKINGVNSDGTATLYMDMNSLKKYGLSPNFTTIPVNGLMNQPNSMVFFQASFTRL